MSRLNEYNPIFGVVFEEPPKPKWLQDLEEEEAAEKGKGGGAAPPKAPQGSLPGFPPGTVMRGENAGIGPNNLWYYRQPDGSVKEGFAASAEDRRAAGTGGGTTTSGTKPGGTTTNYQQQNIANERAAQLATGKYLEAPPPGYTMILNGAKAVGPGGAYAWDNTSNLWYPTFVTKEDRQMALSTPQQGTASGVNPTPQTPALSPVGSAVPGGANLQGFGGTLTPEQTPQFASFQGSVNPGYGVPTEGRQFAYTGSGLNNLTVNRQGSGANGPVVLGSPLVAPRSLGYGPAVSTNMRTFGSGGPATTPASRQFASVPVSVPGGYMAGSSGYSIQGAAGPAFQAFDLPINATAPSAAGPGGVGLITQSGPQNASIRNADGGTTGWSTGGMVYNDPFAVYGRQGSTDAATRTVQSAQIMDARNELLAAGYGPQAVIAAMTAPKEDEETTGIDPDGGGFRGYAKGGRVATGPLGGGVDQVTNEPIFGIGALTNKKHFVVGEGDANRDGRFDPEVLTITPMREYAEGGKVATSGYAPNGISEGVMPLTKPTTTGLLANQQQYLDDKPTTTGQTVNQQYLDPLTALPALPPLPTSTTTPVIDTGPEQNAALRTARIQQQQQQQDILRGRAGLGGSTAIRTNADLKGLAPGYYALPADYSQQVADLQTKLAGLGPIPTDPNSLLTYQNQLKTLLDPMNTAQTIQNDLLGLGTLGDPAQLQANAQRLKQLMEPLKQAQDINTRIMGYGQVGDPTQLQQDINDFKVKSGPLVQIQDLNQKLTQLGPAYDPGSIQAQADYVTSIKSQMNQYANADPFTNPTDWQMYSQFAASLDIALNHLNKMQSHNNQVQDTQNGIAYLLQASGLDQSTLPAALANYATQLDAKEQQYKAAIDVAGLRAQLAQYAPPGTDIDAMLGQYAAQLTDNDLQLSNVDRGAALKAQLANYVPDGTDISGRIGQITGLMDQSKSMYDNYGQAQQLQTQIQSYRNNTNIEGIDQGVAPAPVVAQAVVSTPALKTISQTDPQSANALARIDYAMSEGGQWTPATSQLLVNLTNSLSSSGAKDSVQAMLQGLISKMPQSRGVPPALAAAALSGSPAQVGAAAKFGAAA